MLKILILLSQLAGAYAGVHLDSKLPDFPPCDPISDLSYDPKTVVATGVENSEPPLPFCEKWNPDFPFNGHLCCSKLLPRRHPRRSRAKRCSPIRGKVNFCDEMTDRQKLYRQAFLDGKDEEEDILQQIQKEINKDREQAYCTVNNGFLVNGREIIPTSKNRIVVHSPHRCLNFGTDEMVGMLEWLGRQIDRKYSEMNYSRVRLVIGDVSGPRGGCLYGPSGRVGHASHTTGQDADVGFLTTQQGGEIPHRFQHRFDPASNWWLLKKIFENPFACIKVIFLDRHLIATLAKYAKTDKDWFTYHRFIRHMPGHKNHLHIRIGNTPGQPGCGPGARPELEFEEDDDDISDPLDASIMDRLIQSRQGASIQK